MKLKPFISLVLTIGVFFFLSSCKDFIEPSISKRQLTLNAPSDKYQSTNYTVNFWWNDVEDALSYRLQIVAPGFDSIGGLIVDTLVKSSKIALTLDPGKYQWHVRGENGSSQTAYSPARSLEVLSSSLTNQNLPLSLPANNTLTNQSSVTLKWTALYGATQYHLQIDSNSFADETKLVKDVTIPGQQFAFAFPKEQVYQWRVRAENDKEQSKWSQVYQISYDPSPPAPVTLLQPQDRATVSQPVSLSWNKIAGTSTYKLYVFKSDQKTLYNNSFPLTVNTDSYNFNSGNTGEQIYWQVSAVDAAGNEGQRSGLRSFTIQ